MHVFLDRRVEDGGRNLFVVPPGFERLVVTSGVKTKPVEKCKLIQN